MIKPTIGRVVWFYPSRAEGTPEPEQAFPGLVCRVWSDTCINIAGFDHNCMPLAAGSVKLLQDDETPESAGLTRGYYARWMPYQVGQAKKHEAEGGAK